VDNRRINIAVWDMPNGEVCKVTVSYPTVAGLDRVYSVSVQPMTISRDEYGTLERYTPSRGYRWKLEAAPRYSRKRLDTLAEDPDTFDKARNMYRRCLADIGAAE
jgi:hypothetical protein